MRIGETVTARVNAQKITILGEVVNTEPREIEVYIAVIKGNRLKVADKSGLVFPDDFILTDGVWRTTHGWYVNYQTLTA